MVDCIKAKNKLHRFPNLRLQRVRIYFIPRGKQQLVTNPIPPLYPDFQWLGHLQNESPICKDGSFQSSSYTMDPCSIIERSPLWKEQRKISQFPLFWRNWSSLKDCFSWACMSSVATSHMWLCQPEFIKLGVESQENTGHKQSQA